MIAAAEAFPVLLPENPDNVRVDAELWAAAFPLDTEDLVYEKLGPDSDGRARERETFRDLDEPGPLPDLRPTAIDPDQLHQHRSAVQELRGSLGDYGLGPAVTELYDRKLAEDDANLRLLLAAHDGDPEAFAQANTELYGIPDAWVFAANAAWHCRKAEIHRDSPHREIRQVADDTVALLGRYAGYASILFPDQTLHDAIKAQFDSPTGYMHVVMDGVVLPETGLVTPENFGDAAMRRMIANLGSGHTIVDADGWSMGAEELRRPDDFKMPAWEFREFTLHELRHLIERVNGLRGPLKLASTGTDRHTNGNEGQAIPAEILANPDRPTHFGDTYRGQELLGRQLVVALANGSTGVNATIREAGHVLTTVNRLSEYTRPGLDSIAAATGRADDLAWQQASGAYQGTAGDGAGGSYRRPMVYMEGLVRFMDVLRTKGLHWLDLSGYAKFDAANETHVRLLRDADVLPDTRHLESAGYRG